MPYTDLPPDHPAAHDEPPVEPDGFDAFWSETLEAAREAGRAPELRPVRDSLLTTLDAYDVRFPGWGGDPVAAWLVVPSEAEAPLPAVITYLGYSGGRGLVTDHLLYASAGYAHLVVDSRGQGHDTPDPHPATGTHWVHGYMTRGIEDPHQHYYRRLVTDCVRAVDAARLVPHVDPDRIVVQGNSQGGGLALAVAGLVGDDIAGALPDVPFLCHFRRGAETATEGPYTELVDYLRQQAPHAAERVFSTLAHFDGVHFARRATAPALFSAGLMDPVCPPSTVLAAYRNYAGEKDIREWPFADHAGGRGVTAVEHLRWLRRRGLAPTEH
ncbi:MULTISPECIES: acetylxylan esterase [Streptomyces]|uniref:acetylxylan esterase n=1 Tax=Streptomyces TaxID=1883 RepID=UPI0009403ABA|nr:MULTISPECIES: acetylxylan esterase [Streptomyces]MBX9422387.1 acetylxylan esterase [Streptomyces lateritius]OKJ60680.1 acetyl xylan esterase [Streptomyces sp. CB02261]